MRERSVGRKRRAGSAPCGSCCWLSPTLCAFRLRRTPLGTDFLSCRCRPKVPPRQCDCAHRALSHCLSAARRGRTARRPSVPKVGSGKKREKFPDSAHLRVEHAARRIEVLTGSRAAAERLEQRLELLAARGAAEQLAMAEQRGGGYFNGRALVECSRRSVPARKCLSTRGRGGGARLVS
jgi:hypothetical protein